MMKQAKNAVADLPPEYQQEIRFKMEGLRADYQQDDTFILMAPTVNIDYGPAIRSLLEQGLDGRLVDEVVEDMANAIFTRQLAALFAKRMVRV